MCNVTQTHVANFRPRATGYWIAGVMLLVAAGSAAFGWWQYHRYVNRPPLARIVVPGSATVQLDTPGYYRIVCADIFACTTTYPDGTVSHRDGPAVPALQTTITNLATQQAVPMHKASSTQFFEAEQITHTMEGFDIDTPGQYQIEIAYKSPPLDPPLELALVRQHFDQVHTTLLISLGIAMVLGLVALIIGLVTITRRVSAKRRRRLVSSMPLW